MTHNQPRLKRKARRGKTPIAFRMAAEIVDGLRAYSDATGIPQTTLVEVALRDSIPGIKEQA